MSSRSMSLDVLVRLRDQLTGPLRRLRDQLKSIADFGRKLGLLGAAIAAISFMGPIKEAAAFQQKLLDIAVTAGLSGKKAFEFTDQLRRRFYELGIATGQATDDIASGYGQMIAAGLDPSLVDASIGTIAKAATAANAEFADMSQVATSLLQTLKVPADELDDALGALVTAGKLGSFELKDMAKYFPSLTSQMAKFGVTGREAVNYLGAALQIARKGTSDPAEAANNLKNFLSKILAPATIKNFKDAGVDIEAVMKDAATKGINPIEAVMQKIVKLTGTSGDEIGKLMKKAQDQGLSGADALAQVREQLEKIHGAGKLGEIFADQQVMDFLIPFLANVDELKRIKAEVAKATGASINKDFDTQIKALKQQLQILDDIRQHASDEVGLAFGEWLPWLNENLEAAIKWYREFNAANDNLGRKLLVMSGGGVIAALALGALGVALPVIGAGFGVLLGLLSPVGIALAAVAGGAYLLYKNWDAYGPRVFRVWRGALRMWDSVKDMFKGFSPAGLRGLGAGLAAFLGLFSRRIPALYLLQDLFQWLNGKASLIDDLAKSLSKLTGIDAGKLSKVLAGVAAGGVGLLLFGGTIGKVAGGVRALAVALGLLGGSSAAKGIATLSAAGSLSVASGLFLLAGSAAAAAASVKLFFDAWKEDKDLNGAIKDKFGKGVMDWFADNILGGNRPDQAFANDNPLLGPQNKPTVIDPGKKLREQLKATTVDLEAVKLTEAKKEADRVRFRYGPQRPKDTADAGNDNKRLPAVAKQQQKVDVSGTISIVVKGNADVSASSSNPNVKLTTGKTGRVVGGV